MSYVNAAPGPQQLRVPVPGGEISGLALGSLQRLEGLEDRLQALLARCRGAELRGVDGVKPAEAPSVIGTLQRTDAVIDGLYETLDRLESCI